MKFRLMILTCLFILISICVYSADNSKQGTNTDIKEAQNAVFAIYRTHYRAVRQLSNGQLYVTPWKKCEKPNVAGSGFFINKDGYFLTCYHVFNCDPDNIGPDKRFDYIPTNPMELTDKVNYMFIRTNDNKRIPFKVVDFDNLKDIALCKVLEGHDYSFIPLANSQEVDEASKCYSIGTPLTNALKNTITDGIISSTDRSLADLYDVKIKEEEKRYNYSFIQHSSPITHGNSGGPLLNEYGACIGINTQGIEGFESYGWAICINHAKGILDDNTVEYEKWHGPTSIEEDIVIRLDEDNKNYYYTDKDNKKVYITKEEVQKKSDGTKYVTIDGKDYNLPEQQHDYTLWYIIGGAVLLIFVCIIIYLIIINNKKPVSNNSENNNQYYQPNYSNYNSYSNNQYSTKSKDNYDDIDIELF